MGGSARRKVCRMCLEQEHAAGQWRWMRPGGCALSYLVLLRTPLGVWSLSREIPQKQALTALAGVGTLSSWGLSVSLLLPCYLHSILNTTARKTEREFPSLLRIITFTSGPVHPPSLLHVPPQHLAPTGVYILLLSFALVSIPH